MVKISVTIAGSADRGFRRCGDFSALTVQSVQPKEIAVRIGSRKHRVPFSVVRWAVVLGRGSQQISQRFAQAQIYSDALDRVVSAAHWQRTALLCSERKPLECHLCRLLGPSLMARDVAVTWYNSLRKT